jgi:hypothetical protein
VSDGVAAVVLGECLTGGGVKAENRVAASTPPRCNRALYKRGSYNLQAFIIDQTFTLFEIKYSILSLNLQK